MISTNINKSGNHMNKHTCVICGKVVTNNASYIDLILKEFIIFYLKSI